MIGVSLFSTIPKLIAILVIGPLLLILLWFTWQTASRSRVVQANWTRVQARVVDASPGETVTLELPWRGDTIRQEVKRENGFENLTQAQTLPLYVNPLNCAEIRPATFAELWTGAIVLAGFSLFLAGTGLFLMRVEDPKMPEMPAELMAQFQRAASNPEAPKPRLPHADDGRLIEMREPSESWKANVFWGLLFGLLLVVPPFFAPKDTPAWKKYGAMALGVAWMAFMGRSAIQNRGTIVRCDSLSIQISRPFRSERILLSAVKQVVRDDVRQKLRDLEDAGRSRSRTKPLDTMAPIVLYILRDIQGKELLRLNQNMEPASEMRRFLNRMENLTGNPIIDQ
jgi:hypothetical protein